MARRKKKTSIFGGLSLLKNETIQSVIAILLFVLSVFLLLAFFDKAGLVGSLVTKLLIPLLGWGYLILPVVFVALGIAFLLSIRKNLALTQSIAALVFFLAGLGLVNLIFPEKGGLAGSFVTNPLIKLFDGTITVIVLVSLLIVSSLVIFDLTLNLHLFWRVLKGIKNILFKKAELLEKKEDIDDLKINVGKDIEEESEKELPVSKNKNELEKKSSALKKGDDLSINLGRISVSGIQYKAPPLSLLSKDSGKPGVGDIKANANIIKRTLQNFGIFVEMDEVTIGPTVTRYALKPAEGVKISRILNLQNDLALALAAHPIRIEAPIPGKSLVGIEIPNTVKTTVGLGTILAEDEFQKSPKSLLISLGKAISGKSSFDDIAKMPHLLIAGSTGAGKSVCIHSIITSLLYRNSPENLKLILIDPKRVELTLYNKIPHLPSSVPVLTDPKKAILALKWATKEMDRRYNIFEEAKVRDITSYHKNVLEPALKSKKSDPENMPEAMPYIVIVIDELADIMSTYPREMEAAVVRLAQMSRAVGIHLILSTQRPSVNVITGLIKANIPTRIALQVASQVDSRTILDMSGAEKLLGAGDMLYLSSESSKPQRVQGAYISESEVKEVVKYIIENNKELEDSMNVDLDQSSSSRGGIDLDSADSGKDDELYEEARELVLKAGKASTSYLQRRLRIGYARAARLIDILEERGVVGPGEGSKPRDVLSDGYDNPEDENSQFPTDISSPGM